MYCIANAKLQSVILVSLYFICNGYGLGNHCTSLVVLLQEAFQRTNFDRLAFDRVITFSPSCEGAPEQED